MSRKKSGQLVSIRILYIGNKYKSYRVFNNEINIFYETEQKKLILVNLGSHVWAVIVNTEP